MSVNNHGDAAGSTARARRPRGRPRGRRNLLRTEQQFLEAILRVAAMKLGGGRTLYDANVNRLSRGDEARLASRTFLDIVHMAGLS